MRRTMATPTMPERRRMTRVTTTMAVVSRSSRCLNEL
jgi:hypothetical protein